jgi:hypothetical protein
MPSSSWILDVIEAGCAIISARTATINAFLVLILDEIEAGCASRARAVTIDAILVLFLDTVKTGSVSSSFVDFSTTNHK